MSQNKGQRVKGWWSLGVAALASFLLAGAAMAGDRLTLANGTVLEGEVVREEDGAVFFKTADGKIVMYSRREIKSLEKGVTSSPAESAAPAVPATAEPAVSPAVKPAEKRDDARARTGSAPRAVVLTMGDDKYGDMVGLYMNAKPILDVIPMLLEDKIDIVVFRIKSGGGALLEIQRLSDAIHNEYKKHFKVVAWIDSAISAAAMTAHCIEDIYFTPQGNYGACTGWFGQLTAVKGRELEEVLYMMEQISARGNHNPLIMRAMQIAADKEAHDQLGITGPPGYLSANIDSNGAVAWYADTTSGKYVLNPKGGVTVLTFNAVEAEKFKFSRGTASTLAELTEKMGYKEIEWVGKPDKEFIWPVHRAEQFQLDFRRKVATDEKNINTYWSSYQTAMQMAQQQQEQGERGKFVGIARGHFNKIKSMVKNNPNFKLFVFNMTDEQFEEFVEEQEKRMRDLMKERR